MKQRSAYLIGGGLASLASAAYLIRDGGFSGSSITIFEENRQIGGSLDADLCPRGENYFMRGYRMLEQKVYSCLFDLISFIPSLHAPGMTVLEEYEDFNNAFRVNSSSRLIADGNIVDAFPFDLTMRDRVRLLWFLTLSEEKLEGLRIDEYFSSSFFTTNFWYQFCTTFAFQPWHSLTELKRYILRFYHVSSQLSSMECVQLTPHNEYESIIVPLLTWLQDQGVRFELGVHVADCLQDTDGRVTAIVCQHDDATCSVPVDRCDLVFATLGSMTTHSTLGSMEQAPACETDTKPTWQLWETLAARHSSFGRPAVFSRDVEKSQWTSFSMTFRDPLFCKRLKELSSQEIGTEGAVSITDSNWFLSFAMTPYPYFSDQPADVSVGWGYGMFVNEPGNFVRKKMTACSGREILIELCSHLGFQDDLERILASATCIPCLMPYITSQFMPRRTGDRPAVVSSDRPNLAVLGQFCEIPEDIVFTLEYSVRAAQIGVYSLLGLEKEAVPVYRGYTHPRYIYHACRTVLKHKPLWGGDRGFVRKLSDTAVAAISIAGGMSGGMFQTVRRVLGV